MTRFDREFAQQPGAKPRICLATRRVLAQEAFEAAMYEAEDVLSATSNVDLIEIRPGWGFAVRNKAQRSLLYRGVSPLAPVNPGLQKVLLTQEYDIYIAVCQHLWDLLYLNSIVGWKDRANVSVCWLVELWAADIPRRADLMRLLRRFDYVVLGSQGAVEALSQFLGRQCHLVPAATDTLRFSPFPRAPDRSIDVYSMGRRWEGVHGALLSAASEQGLFYLYDSCRGLAKAQTFNHAQHRELLANLAKRSKYFVVSPGKMNSFEETRGQVEIGYRYFEGAAAGAVMVGQAADCEAFRELFPWPDIVLEVNPDGSDVLQLIAHLDSEPERVRAISHRNAVESLLRHDWVHRWLRIFQIAGVEPSPGMRARVERLEDLARAASSARVSSPDLISPQRPATVGVGGA
jgi:hypothetical protein